MNIIINVILIIFYFFKGIITYIFIFLKKVYKLINNKNYNNKLDVLLKKETEKWADEFMSIPDEEFYYKISINGEISIYDLLLIKYLNGKTEDREMPQRFNRKPLKEEICKFINYGYIKLTYDLNYNLRKQTITTLKELLSIKNIKIKGNKKDILEAILNNFDKEYLENKFSTKSIVLTQKGEKLIEHNYCYIFAIEESSMYQIEDTLKLLHNERYFLDNWNWRDIVWLVLNKQWLANENNPDIKPYILRNISLSRADLTFKEKKYEVSLLHYFVAFRILISGSGENNWSVNKFYKAFDLKYPKYLLQKYKNYINNLSKEEIYYIMIETENFISFLEFNYFNTDEAFKIMIDMINDEDKPLKEYNYIHVDLNKYTEDEYFYFKK